MYKDNFYGVFVAFKILKPSDLECFIVQHGSFGLIFKNWQSMNAMYNNSRFTRILLVSRNTIYKIIRLHIECALDAIHYEAFQSRAEHMRHCNLASITYHTILQYVCVT